MPEHLTVYLQKIQDPWIVGAFLTGLGLASLLWYWRLRRREQRLADRAQLLTRAEAQIEHMEAHLTDLREEVRRRTEESAARREAEAELRARLDESRKHFAEKEALLRASGESLEREFELLANRVFERQGEQHQARLATVLSPFKDQLDDFKKRVETVYTTETRDRATLLTEVRNLQQASERINREAENLTRALKGDVKAQGNWGEMVLEKVLESSGLRQGEEYVLQTPLRHGDGSLKRPDVLIRLPDDKDVVVDAKVSLLAYEQALAEEEEGAREQAVREHVASMRSHVKRLSEQDYDRLQNVRSLDFVLMFVPIEAAFTMAMEHDQKLFAEAFERRIVIVSPTTLMMTLRIIHNLWRYEKQNRNAQEIARRAGALYDKLRAFVEDMENLGRQLQTAENTYQAAFSKLSSGKGNLLRRAEAFRELGAPVKKTFPPHLLDDDEDDEESMETLGAASKHGDISGGT